MPENENYNLAKTDLVNELKQDFKALDSSTPKTLAQELQKALAGVQSVVREQQMSTEQQLQAILSQAATCISGSQRLDSMFNLTQRLNPLLQDENAVRGNIQQIKTLLEQLGDMISSHHNKVTEQVAQAMQQGLSAMAQAQSGMFEARAFVQLEELIRSCKTAVSQMEQPQPTVQ